MKPRANETEVLPSEPTPETPNKNNAPPASSDAVTQPVQIIPVRRNPR